MDNLVDDLVDRNYEIFQTKLTLSVELVDEIISDTKKVNQKTVST